VRIGELALTVDLGDAGKELEIATLDEARVEQDGRLVTMRRSGFTPRADFQLEATRKTKRAPLTVSRFAAGGEAADYVMARYVPEVDWSAAGSGRADVVVVVDTSAGGDEATRQLRQTTAEAILRALSGDDRFAVVALDVRATVLHPETGLAEAKDKEMARALERLAEHGSGGATDLGALFDSALGLLHGSEQAAVVYVGDGRATSGELTGEQLVARLERALASSRARLFTMAVGPEADAALLGEVARAGGGGSFRVEVPAQATARALELMAAVKVPTLTDFELDLGAGLDEPFMNVTGKVARGTEVVLLARTHHDLPPRAKVRGRIGGKPFEQEVEVKKDDSVLAAFVPRLWAQAYVRRLLGASAGPDEERGRIVALGLEYGLVTPFTSILALESESAYARMRIQRNKSPLRGVRLGMLGEKGEREVRAWLQGPPDVAFGCSRSEKAAASEEDDNADRKTATASPAPVAQTESTLREQEKVDDKEGGSGTRARGDEGSMSAGPRGAPEPMASGAANATPPAEDSDGENAELEPGKARPAGGLGRNGQDGPPVPSAVPPAQQPRPETKPDVGKQIAGGKGGDKDKKPTDVNETPPQPKRERWREPARVVVGTCSDLARRPLAERMLLWKKRIATATGPGDLLQRYELSQRACELEDWRAERAFLELLQEKIDSEAAAIAVLSHFGGRPDVQAFVARLVLRRTVDERIVAAVERTLFGRNVDWLTIDRDLSAVEDRAQRIIVLREALAKSPDDPNGQIRLVEELSGAGQADEALSLAARLRERGLLTPTLLRRLGDVLATNGREADAVRTYSEIVEFDSTSLPSRLLLGDVYLEHGWYEPAYRQYVTATEAAPNDALAWLRLASAAAGSGRVDEALRIERKVASAQGRPGPDDPRRWARLSSAARIARLIAEPPKEAPDRQSLERELKELALFGGGPGRLVIVGWEDLQADLVLVTRVGETEIAVGEQVDAAPVGLSAVIAGTTELAGAALVVRLRSLPRPRELDLTVADISWDGTHFQVSLRRMKLDKRSTKLEL
jgi:Ca-activated chloride channel homolog